MQRVYSISVKVFIRQLLICCLLFTVTAVSAQNKLATDRPDQTDGASAVDLQHLQVESQFYYTGFHDSKPALVSANLVRYGVANHLEARLNVEQGLRRDRFISEGGEGGYPLGVGLKYTLVEDVNGLPYIGFIGLLQVPVTNGGDQTHYWSPGVSIALEKDFGQHWDITTNVGLKQHAFDSEFGWAVTGNLKYSWADRLDIFGEYFAEYGQQAPDHHIDGGVLYHIGEHWLVFASAGSKIIHPDHFFMSAGFAVDVDFSKQHHL